MADIFSVKKRSQIMSRIRSRGTSPELRLESLVRSLLPRHHSIQIHPANISGTPDIFVPSLRLAIFLDGCFFHRCPVHGHIPKSNRAYWKKKIERNCQRDMGTRRQLRAHGYAVWRLWEHQLKTKSQLQRTRDILRKRLIKLRKIIDKEHVLPHPSLSSS